MSTDPLASILGGLGFGAASQANDENIAAMNQPDDKSMKPHDTDFLSKIGNLLKGVGNSAGGGEAAGGGGLGSILTTVASLFA